MTTIGKTQLVELRGVNPNPSLVRILAKCEFQNPTLSMKDRIVRHIFDMAEQTGELKKGATVIAASSGNTAVAVAMQCARRGYKAIIVTNDKCSKEKIAAPKAYGAEVVVMPSGLPPDDPRHYQQVALRLKDEIPGAFDVDQYDNPNNPGAYYASLGPEIWEQADGNVDVFVAGASTGGTVSGTGKYLKEQNPEIQVVLADPVGSIFYEYWRSREVIKPKSFLVEGVGKDSIPGALDIKVCDLVHQVTDLDAFTMCRRVAQKEGLLIGGSAGANVAVCCQIAAKCTVPTTIVTVLCDHGSKYWSTVYNDDFWVERGLPLPDFDDDEDA